MLKDGILHVLEFLWINEVENYRQLVENMLKEGMSLKAHMFLLIILKT